ncbi:hypothetical protein [Paenibacillus daejeonensis]|uniref:hypothetical protein n=1 Tax=Paenibacillus daejeonensis TaxID=135193 RepID=UPI00036FADE3|nr:hypothetical protein [Paenibacillus daejeonensis]
MDKPQLNKRVIRSSQKVYSWLGVVVLLLFSIPVSGAAAPVERPLESADHPILTAPGESGYLITPRFLHPKKHSWAGIGILVIAIGAMYYRRTPIRMIVISNACIAIAIVMQKLAPIKMTSTYVSRFPDTLAPTSR